MIVDNGPASTAATTPTVNTLYTTVVVCEPNTSTCQSVDHIQVDTGSYGLRIMGSVLTAVSLPAVTDSNHNALAECTPFVDGSSWGPLRQADVKIGGETAAAQVIQVIGDPHGPGVPSGCTGKQENTVSSFGANGILGIGPFIQDCGSGCTTQLSSNPYYVCTSTASTSCTQTTVALTAQVSNPVAAFTTDNNGVAILLPTVASSGAPSVSGYLVFGIGTQGNNGLGNAKIYDVDPSSGAFTTVFSGQSLKHSFLDSGSNAYFFSDAPSSLPTCTDNAAFYCPSATQNLSATIQGSSGTSATVPFSIANADSLFSGASMVAALSNLGGPISSTSGFGATDVFDWGLPFYYGRTVYTAFEAHTTSAGNGPYFAF
ncbi:MAG: DUF3443 domain-containing protein [Sinobacteraceae bacterium]|nr:DUF3443 domain-containing protein [Nevskiaceae bacterium]